MSLVHKAKESFVKIYNLVQREIAYTQQIDHSGKYIPYFENHDGFPVELSNLVQGSPTATSCLSTFADFITGEGFNEGADVENLVINKQGLKLFQFHSICASELAHKWGVACIVKYNKIGGITEIIDIPFSYCRLGVPDSNGLISKIKYNPYFGTAIYNKKDTIEYDVFNPEQAAVQAAKDPKWKGQINWVAIRDGKHPFYPVPDYYAAKHWMSVEKNAGEYFDENLKDGFLQDVVMKMIGDPNDPSGLKDSDDKDIPKGRAFDQEVTQNFGRGSKTRAKMWALWGASKEEWPELQAFPTSGNPDLFRVQDEHAIKKITIATKVPGVLANINDTNNFSGEQVRPAVKLMQQRAVRPQNFLLDFYQPMLAIFINPVTERLGIVDYNPYPEAETVDAQTWGVLTTEEKRKWVKDHTEIEIVDEVQPPTQEPTQPAVENVLNGTPKSLHFNSYPQKAKQNVKRALEWQEKMNKKCSTAFGLKLSQAILDGVPLGPKEIRRLSNFLSKNALSSTATWTESCDAVAYYAWGGPEMMEWANDKVKELKGETD